MIKQCVDCRHRWVTRDGLELCGRPRDIPGVHYCYDERREWPRDPEACGPHADYFEPLQ